MGRGWPKISIARYSVVLAWSVMNLRKQNTAILGLQSCFVFEQKLGAYSFQSLLLLFVCLFVCFVFKSYFSLFPSKVTGAIIKLSFTKGKSNFLFRHFFLRFSRTWTKRYLVTSQTRVKRVSRIHHRTILKSDKISENDFSGWRPAIAFLYLFLFHSLLRLTPFLSQNKINYLFRLFNTWENNIELFSHQLYWVQNSSTIQSNTKNLRFMPHKDPFLGNKNPL